MPNKFERMSICAPVCEISSESNVAGRRPIKLVLHEIHPDDSHYQENGLSWDEEFVSENLSSVCGMSITVEFLTENRDIPYGHGMTGIRDCDNLPLFEDATMVGFFDKAYIDDIEINGETKRVLIAEGTLDEMRYPKFVAWLREHMEESVVKGSVEIVGKQENNKHIIYADGWKETGRVPMVYDYSGYAILGIRPADELAVIMELNNKNQTEGEGEEIMNEEMRKAIEEAVSNVVAEQNSKWDTYYASVQEKEAQITQLQADIAAKEAEIVQLRADYETEMAKAAAAEAGLTEMNAKLAEMEKESKIAELNKKLEDYSDEQRAVAADDIAAFNEDPSSVEINSIIGKICTEIVRNSKDTTVSEVNMDIDIFGIGEESAQHEADDDEIF